MNRRTAEQGTAEYRIVIIHLKDFCCSKFLVRTASHLLAEADSGEAGGYSMFNIQKDHEN